MFRFIVLTYIIISMALLFVAYYTDSPIIAVRHTKTVVYCDVITGKKTPVYTELECNKDVSLKDIVEWVQPHLPSEIPIKLPEINTFDY